MGEDLTALERSQRSTLLPYQLQTKARRSIDKLLNVRLPTYNLRDFEREIYLSQHTIVGDGLVFPNFRFAPNVSDAGDTQLFQKNRSVRILKAHVQNDDVVPHNLGMFVSRAPGQGLNPIVTMEGQVQIAAGSARPIIGVPQTFFNAVGDVSLVMPESIELYSNKPGQTLADLLNITSLSVLSNLLQLSLIIMWETIPDPVDFGASLAAVTGTP